MEMYIGTKILKAEPMNLGDYNEHRGWTITDNENPDKDGFLVEYEDGYQSWSPKEAFDGAYRLCNAMNFGLAMEAARMEKRIARPGWNGNGMYAFCQFPDADSKMTHPYLVMSIPDCPEGDRLLPWQPAQVDIFADDWMIVE